MVQQTQVVAQLAPGRFRLGVGPSHRPMMESMGMNFTSPLGHLREYVHILKACCKKARWISTAIIITPTTVSRSP
jgi:alkanesulfonate monooxygenase SsuD/methylene tetrahydromethanopterin reductase-like flavin-dependent oxidoreductase (luciferase family)